MIRLMNTNKDSLIPWAPTGLTALLLELSNLALAMQQSVAPSCKADGTLVTEADTKLEDVITAFLKVAEPESFVLGEETLALRGTDYLASAMAGRCWVLDPIDGTALYALGIDGWGISIGLMDRGILLDGIVAYPKRGIKTDSVQFLFSSGTAVMSAEALLEPDSAYVESTLQSVKKPLTIRPAIPGYPGQISTSQRFAKSGSYLGRHPIICFASSVHTFNLLMGGALVAYLVKLKLWDLAAVWPMAWRLGIRACQADGSPIGLNLEAAVWCLDPADPQFLGLRDHILIYWPDRVEPAVWQDIRLPALSI